MSHLIPLGAICDTVDNLSGSQIVAACIQINRVLRSRAKGTTPSTRTAVVRCNRPLCCYNRWIAISRTC